MNAETKDTVTVDGTEYEVEHREFVGKDFPCEVRVGGEVVGFEEREQLEEYVANQYTNDSITGQIDDLDEEDVRSDVSDTTGAKIRTTKLEDWELLASRENDRFGNTETHIYETPDGQLVVISRNMDGLNSVKQVGDEVKFKILGVREYGDTSGEFNSYVEVDPQHANDDGRRGAGDPTGWIEDAWNREIVGDTFNEYGFQEITSDTFVFEDEHEGVVYKVEYTLVEGDE